MISKTKGKLLAAALIIPLLVVLLPFSASAELPGYSAGLRAYPQNPVLGLGAASAWNEAATGAASVINDSGTYKMWVTGFRADGSGTIGYETSTDGKTWTAYGSNPLTALGPGAPGAWNELGVGSPSVIRVAGTYRMWYTGYANGNGGTLIPSIGYATSPDGTTWTPYAGNPVLIGGGAGTFTESGVLSPSVILDGATLKMWFTGRSAAAAGETIGTLRVGYATSANGTTWAPNANPVLSSSATSWESRGVGPAAVVKDGSTYYMWYTASSGTGTSLRTVINGATSSDGTTWAKNGPSALLSGQAGTWTALGVGSPAVVKQTGNIIRMWYSGIDITGAPRTGFAFSIEAEGQVTLQGGSRPPASRAVPVVIKIFTPGANVMSATPLATISTSTADTGSNNVTFNISSCGVVAGTYDISIKMGSSLVNVKRNVAIDPPQVIILGTLRQGNANDDGQVNILDFSILAASYLKANGQAGYDARADFDGNNAITTLDFSLLASNYLRSSPQLVP